MHETVVKKRRKKRPGLVGVIRDVRKRTDLSWNWQYAWTDLGGKAHYEYSMNKDDARRRRHEVTESRRKGREVAPSEDTLAERAAAWHRGRLRDRAADEAQEVKPKTDRALAWAVAKISAKLGDVRLMDLTAATIKEFALRLREGEGEDKPLGGATVGNLLGYLNQILEEAVTERVLYRNPMIDYRRAQPKKKAGRAKRKAPMSTEAEMDRFTHTALDLYPPEESLYGVMLTLALWTGLREGELLGLRWDHVHLDGDAPYIDVQHGWDQKLGFITPKTPASYREVPLLPVVVEALERWRGESHARWNRTRERPHMAERVCPISPEQYQDPMRRIIKAAGLTIRASIHLLRHQYCSAMAQRNVPPVVLKEWAGHSSIEMTLSYYAKAMDTAPIRQQYLEGFGLARKVPGKVTPFRKTQAA